MKYQYKAQSAKEIEVIFAYFRSKGYSIVLEDDYSSLEELSKEYLRSYPSYPYIVILPKNKHISGNSNSRIQYTTINQFVDVFNISELVVVNDQITASADGFEVGGQKFEWATLDKLVDVRKSLEVDDKNP